MGDTAPSVIVDRLVTLIEAVADIGLVHPYPIRDRNDLHALLVSEIDGHPTLRAWSIEGPNIEAEWLTSMGPPQHVNREWTWEIHGFEGLAPAGDGDSRSTGGDIATIRDNALAVMDALDAGESLNLGLSDAEVFASEPCRIRQRPIQTVFRNGDLPLAYVVVEKRIRTVPARD